MSVERHKREAEAHRMHASGQSVAEVAKELGVHWSKAKLMIGNHSYRLKYCPESPHWAVLMPMRLSRALFYLGARTDADIFRINETDLVRQPNCNKGTLQALRSYRATLRRDTT